MYQSSQSEAPPQTKVSDLPSSLSPRLIRFKHIIVAFLLSVVFFLLFCFIALHGYIAWVLSNPTVAPVFSNPMQAKNMKYEDITFPADGWRPHDAGMVYTC